MLFTELVPVIEARGLSVQEQSSFYKIATPGKAVYVSKTKRAITRVDIAGFDLSHPAVSPPAKPNGKVTGQVDMAHEGALDAITQAFDVLINGQVQGTKRVPKPKAPKGERKPAKLRARVTADEISQDPNAAEAALAKAPAKWTSADMEAIAEARLSASSSTEA